MKTVERGTKRYDDDDVLERMTRSKKLFYALCPNLLPTALTLTFSSTVLPAVKRRTQLPAITVTSKGTCV